MKKPIWIFINHNNKYMVAVYSTKQKDALNSEAWKAKLKVGKDYDMLPFEDALATYPKEMKKQFGFVKEVKQ